MPRITWLLVDVNTRCKIQKSRRAYQDHEYQTEAAAKAALTRLEKAGETRSLTILDSATYKQQVLTFIVKNLMTGKPVEIPMDTPSFLDPSSETYWST